MQLIMEMDFIFQVCSLPWSTDELHIVEMTLRDHADLDRESSERLGHLESSAAPGSSRAMMMRKLDKRTRRSRGANAADTDMEEAK